MALSLRALSGSVAMNVARTTLGLRLLKASAPASLSLVKRSLATETYVHNDHVQTEQLYSKPKRWPQYNEVVHRPEDGPVERVRFAKMCAAQNTHLLSF